MRTQGILFQGLYFSTKAEVSFLREECSYCEELQREKGHYIDVTYFLLYALCKNPKAGELLRTMERTGKNMFYQQQKKVLIKREHFGNI